MKKIVKLMMILGLGISVVGCATSKSSQNTSVQNTEEGYPIKIDHAFGQTVIESKPERVATVSWGNHDVALALNVAPVGVSKGNFGKLTSQGLSPWTEAAFQKLGVDHPTVFDDTDGLDFEAIAKTEPDVILAAYSGLTQEDYQTLSKIAPVVAYPNEPWQTSWREQVLLNAKGMAMEEEGKNLVKKTDELIVEKLKDYPDLKGKSAAFVWVNASDTSQFYVYLPIDPRASYLTDLGLSFPEKLKEYAKDAKDFSITLSSEYVDLLNEVDILVTYGDDQTLASLQKDRLFKHVPAIQRGSVEVINSTSELAGSATPTVLGIEATLDEYLKLLDLAAKRV